MKFTVNGHTVKSYSEATTALVIAKANGSQHAVKQAEAVLKKYEGAQRA